MKPTYIGHLEIENYKNFKGKQELSFVDEEGYLSQWTIILGNNNAGKTNLLKAIANTELEEDSYDDIGQVLESGDFPNVKAFYPVLHDMYIPLERYTVETTFYSFDDKGFHLRIRNSTLSFNVFIEMTDNHGGGNFIDYELGKSLIMFSYGVNRKSSKTKISESKQSNSATLFGEADSLINIEEWLFKLNYAAKNGEGEVKQKAEDRLEKVKRLVVSEIFPEIMDVRFITDEDLNNYIEFQTKEGWFQLEDLGYGYQSTLSWIVDLSKKMFERYPNVENPLKEPAIVLVDEIDLHLHPDWQKRIVEYLTEHFTATQFIVTTHSPLILQNLEKVNLFILRKNGEGTKIEKVKEDSFQGWEVDEILRLMEAPTRSAHYNELMSSFDKALDQENLAEAEAAYQELVKILHPDSAEHKLLKIQLSQLIPEND
jgi:predicted ATP-binding protein involved in virulence